MNLLQPLTDFPGGSHVVIKELGDCPKGRIRLCAMGLTPGTVVEVEEVTCGPCRIRARGATLVLGKGMASKIIGCLSEEQDACIPCETAVCACAASKID